MKNKSTIKKRVNYTVYKCNKTVYKPTIFQIMELRLVMNKAYILLLF
jgi:hypothetical protein